MNKDIQRRFFNVNLETRETEDVGIISGRPIVYNSRADIGGFFDEIIAPGALDNADLTDVRLCLNHDTSYVYARSRRNNPNSTMRLMPDGEGLSIEAGLNIKSSPKSQDYFSAVKRGDMDKMSFMFTVVDEEWRDLDTDKPLRIIKSIGSVIEVSCVTFAAYNSTDINARGKEALDSAREALERAKEQRANAVDTANEDALALAKAKYNFYNGGKMT